MMRSLRFKWSLTLIVTSLVGIVLVGILATVAGTAEYRRFRAEELQMSYASAVLDFFAENKSWEDIERLAAGLPPRQPRRGAPPLSTLFALADKEGKIVKPAGDYKRGDVLSEDELRRGLTLRVNDADVATVLNIALPPFDESEMRFLGRTNAALLIVALAAVAVAVALGLFLSRQFLRPLAELTAAISQVKQGRFNQTVPVRTQDELGELAQAFNQMSAELRRVNHLRRQMTADIAHDLRTPLTVISGYLEGLRDGSLRPTPARFDTIFQEAQRLNRLIDDLRTLSLADAGELPLAYAAVEPRALLEQVADAFALLAAAQGVALRVEAAAGLPPLQIDRDRIVQVLGNLVSNSLRFTPPQGEIVLAAAAQGERLRLTVRDSGSGIPPDELQNIFARFYRVSESRFEQEGESGLGLAIAASIVRAHGGTIAAESEVGSGTAVYIELPAQPQQSVI